MSLKSLKELMVLGTLRAHPMHGYALKEVLESGMGWTVGLTKSTIYAILQRFVDRGWVEGEVVKNSQYPDREIYHVTTEGQRMYATLLGDCLSNLPEGSYPVAAILALFDETTQADQLHILADVLEQRRQRLQALRDFPEHDGLAGQALELLCQQIICEIEMLEDILK